MSDRYVTLKDMAERLEESYATQIDGPINRRLPYDWWKRTKEDRLSIPMPEPSYYVGQSPVWVYRRVVAWYAGYAGLKTEGK